MFQQELAADLRDGPMAGAGDLQPVVRDPDLFREDPALGEFQVHARQGEAAPRLQAPQEIGDMLEADAQQVALEPAQVLAGQVPRLRRVQPRERLRGKDRSQEQVRVAGSPAPGPGNSRTRPG